MDFGWIWFQKIETFEISMNFGRIWTMISMISWILGWKNDEKWNKKSFGEKTMETPAIRGYHLEASNSFVARRRWRHDCHMGGGPSSMSQTLTVIVQCFGIFVIHIYIYLFIYYFLIFHIYFDTQNIHEIAIFPYTFPPCNDSRL